MAPEQQPSSQPRQPGEGSRGRFTLWLLLVIVLSWLVVVPLIVSRAGVSSVPYSRFLTLVRQDRVVKVEIGSDTISGVYRNNTKRVDFVTTRPPGVDEPQLLRELTAHKVEFTGTRPSGIRHFLGTLLAWVLPVLLFVGVWLFLLRRIGGGMGAGAMSLGKSQHKVVDRRDLLTTFKDVAGLDEAVDELREVVDFLKDPRRYQRLGGRVPKGVLLVGAPGTGKTLLARAVAGEANVPFFYLSGSNFVQMFVGLGAARVRDLFEEAKAKAPCIVFIDELDTIGRARAGAFAGLNVHEEREQTLNQLLSEMDGFDPSRGVIIMAATNRPEVLDPALLRPGRFDRQIVVDLPNRRGRAGILAIHARGVVLAPDVDLDVLAARTPGAAGADLANIVNEAALLAARRGKNKVEMAELEEAVDRVSMRPRAPLAGTRRAGTGASCLPRARARADGARLPSRRSPTPRVDRAARSRGDRRHAAASGGGPLPDHAAGARRSTDGADGRPRSGTARLRGTLDRRSERPPAGDRARTPDGRGVRHERHCRPCDARQAEPLPADGNRPCRIRVGAGGWGRRHRDPALHRGGRETSGDDLDRASEGPRPPRPASARARNA